MRVMRMLCKESGHLQLDLLALDAVADLMTASAAVPKTSKNSAAGRPLMLPLTSLFADPQNPRKEVPEAELYELAEDIRKHGILQAIVVQPADADGRHQIHFGAKRWRAAHLVGLQHVPVAIRNSPSDAYAQVAENQKRHGLTPLDLARFIRGRVDGGESKATVAKRLGIDQTTLARHLALLALPPAPSAALRITTQALPRPNGPAQLLARAKMLCTWLDAALVRLSQTDLLHSSRSCPGTGGTSNCANHRSNGAWPHHIKGATEFDGQNILV
jgi:ParB/RepB/Spo0J family partition protein